MNCPFDPTLPDPSNEPALKSPTVKLPTCGAIFQYSVAPAVTPVVRTVLVSV